MRYAVLATCIVAFALGACRREAPAPYYEPMKLGGAVQQTQSE